MSAKNILKLIPIKEKKKKLGRMSEEDKDKDTDLWWDNFCKAPLEENMSDEEKNKIIDWWWEIFCTISTSLDG